MDKIVSYMRDQYVMACIMRETSSEFHKRMQSAVDKYASRTTSGRRRYSVMDQGRAAGIYEFFNADIWQHVEFVYRSPDGKIYGCHKDSVFPYWQESVDSPALVDYDCAHIWKARSMDDVREFTPFCNVNSG